MKKFFSLCLSLWLSICFLIAASAEEDPLTHFKGTGDAADIQAYYDYLIAYLGDLCGEPDPDCWNEAMCRRFSDEMIRIYNEYYNDIDHPYLRGKIDEETGEITITGMRYSAYVSEFYTLPLWDEYVGSFVEIKIKDLVIPDEIDGYPVTEIANDAFRIYAFDSAYYADKALFSTVMIGDNVRKIGSGAFAEQTMKTVKLGKNVEIIGDFAFSGGDNPGSRFAITSWGRKLKTIEEGAFRDTAILSMPQLPDTVEEIKERAFEYTSLPQTFVIPASVKTVGQDAFIHSLGANIFVVLSRDAQITNLNSWCRSGETKTIYCYSGSTVAEDAKNHGFAYTLVAESGWQLYNVELIDGDSLLWDGEAVEGNALKNCVGMTEAELRSHLGIDGTSSEIQIDGLRDGKVVNGTTVTLFHTVAQAPGKVYTVTVERTSGDADGDGMLTLVDVAQLVRYLAGGWNVEIDISNSDVNADGVVNLKDAALLRRYLAGWDITLR